MVKDTACHCWDGKGFPTFAAIILVLGLLWLFTDLGWINVKVPWFPIVMIIFAIGLLVKHRNIK